MARLLDIQVCSPEAAQWSELDYRHALSKAGATRCWVAEKDGCVVGLLLYRATASPETEILNLAVDPSMRRRGVGAVLVGALLETRRGETFLELRSSNEAALRLYQRLGFEVISRRPQYYRDPEEDALLMRQPGAAQPDRQNR